MKVSKVEQAQRAIEARAFERAAGLIAARTIEFSCIAVQWNQGRAENLAWIPDDALRERYAEAFQFGVETFHHEPDPVGCRLLALSFAREMVLTGDL